MKKTAIFTIIMVLSLGFSGCGSNGDKVAETTEGKVPVAVEEVEKEENPEPNTSEMVDSIIKKAKEDAETATDEQKQDALDFAVDNIDNYYADNETMEKAMYCGALLEYSYKENDEELSGIGADLVQAVKYVYRNAEDVEAASTQENLKQLKDSIEKIQ